MFRRLFRKLKKNEMLKTSFYSGIGTVIGFISGFVVQKVVAIFVGPSGVALVGQYSNFLTISTSLANGGIQDGVVKYVAEYKNDLQNKTNILSSSLRITLLLSIIIAVSIVSFSKYLSLILFDDQSYRYVLIIFGVTVVLFGLNKLLLSILNGTGEIKKYVAVNVSTSLFGLFVTASVTYFYGIAGALISLSISQSVVFFISLLFVLKSDWFKRSLFLNKINAGASKKLFKFSLMSLTSLVLPPLVQVGVRNFIVQQYSFDDAGLWDAMMKISNAYLGIITTTLSVYYLPKLSSLSDRNEIRSELFNGYKTIIPILIVISSAIYLLREVIVLTLYTENFMPIKEFFLPQLIGDVFKISSWLLAFLMLAKAKTKMFITTQIVFSTLTYFLSLYFINQFGVIGVIWAGSVKYFIYFIVMLIIFRSYLVKQKTIN